mgnify:CR=1 FL=1
MSQLKVNSIVPTAGIPSGGGGGIIQIKQSVERTVLSVQSSAAHAYLNISSLAVSITPSTNSSKMLLVLDVGMSNTNTGDGVGFRFYNGGTHISEASGTGGANDGAAVYCYNNDGNNMISAQAVHLHSPATTSQVNYQIYWATTTSGTVTRYLNQRNSNSHISASSFTVMEVSA